jgi:type IV pilus assembly protein PilQ
MKQARVLSRVICVCLLVALIFPGRCPVSADEVSTDLEKTSAPLAKTISLDLKGLDILDVLKLLSQQSGINFVAGRNVSGRVTIFAKDVDVWEAFERIVDANDLAYERQGNMVNVMTARDYELLYGERFQERKQSKVVPLKYAKAAQLASVLNQIKSTLGRIVADEPSNTLILSDVPIRLTEMLDIIKELDRPTATRIYTLNYADAEKLKEKVQEMLTPGVGTFSFDVRTNKVVVTDLAEVLTQLDQVIKAYDEKDKEVLIEAKIIQVALTDETSLGIDWEQAFSGINARGRENFSVLDSIVDGTATGAAIHLLSTNGDTELVVEALKAYGKVETIANPRLTVSNNQEAKILVGTKEAYVTTTVTTPTSGGTINAPEVQFVDVGTKLYVTPRIKQDGHIQLKIRPEVSAVDDYIEDIANTRIPIVSTTEAETTVLVKSGSTIIIGGLINTRTENSHNGIPFISNMPLIGNLFKSTTSANNKTERVVMLTPRIVSPSGDEVIDFSGARPVRTVSRNNVDMINPLPDSYKALVRSMLNLKLTRQLRLLSVGSGSLDIKFSISRDGTLVGEPHITSASGIEFIHAATLALKEAVPFPPFPEDAQINEVEFSMAVDYRPES